VNPQSQPILNLGILSQVKTKLYALDFALLEISRNFPISVPSILLKAFYQQSDEYTMTDSIIFPRYIFILVVEKFWKAEKV
jgi:hypothetical protein